MRRENKYRTNKTVRSCQDYCRTSTGNHSSDQICLNKQNRWKLMGLLKEHARSSDSPDKIILRRNYNFYQYNGYNHVLREHPPQHLSFARRPDFIYQPHVNFIKVNQDVLNLVLDYGWKFLNDENNLRNLFDISSSDVPVVLIYFVDDAEYTSLSDWNSARRHAFGGCFADFHTVCWGDYCPFGPRIRGEQRLDSRIRQVLFITGLIKRTVQRPSRRSVDYEYKTQRSEAKLQRREKYKLTKQIRTLQLSN